ncbi:MATE family efflux transporter [Lachnobacterium bovis]|uniref:MATE family efflux transporter n=1 Tax=Lachnobacterium bovis TaxID=140626 RepID=UPI001FA78A4E|nr:MATE family efflux transporter [Lachnobacterium bovis]
MLVMKKNYLNDLRNGKTLTLSQQISLTLHLSLPSILAQLTSVVMQYIDASMVGHLGSNASASIGLVTSTTWLLGGLILAIVAGFTVQVSQSIGAKKESEARNILKHGFFIILAAGIIFALIGTIISPYLPIWLGGNSDICPKASSYFFIYVFSIPLIFITQYAGGMLQATGNMKGPSSVNILMCFMDVIFNWIFIFILKLDVIGAALGTVLAEFVGAIILLYLLLFRSTMLHFQKKEKFSFNKKILMRALKIGAPVAFEQIITGSAYVTLTRIVAPLGSIAVAAHSFAITAESFCYMPGYGIEAASMTIVGQTIGAKRKELAKRLGWLCIVLAMIIMAGSGIFFFFGSPIMMKLLTSDITIQKLGVKVLRLEAFAEPMYAASIVASGVFRGAGDTLIPSIMNFVSMWAVRITLAYFLAPIYGLYGIWLAMFIELNFRGIIFLIRMISSRWLNKSL